jgi:WD40-like Beta Propeller Repeat
VTGRLAPLLSTLLLALPACRGTLSPLSNRLKIGEEAYVLFVADGEDGLGDIFASAPTGGKVFQVTFTRVDERAPALSPDGSMVAFVRGRIPDDTSQGTIVAVLNLVNGAERSYDVPASAVAWSGDGATLYFRTADGLQESPAPPAAPRLAAATGAAAAAADSALRVLLGDPPLGEARACADGVGVCAWLSGGDTASLSVRGEAPARWGADSVTYLEEGGYVIRPLAGGIPRELRWSTPVRHPRGLTYFGGQDSGAAGPGRGTSP